MSNYEESQYTGTCVFGAIYRTSSNWRSANFLYTAVPPVLFGGFLNTHPKMMLSVVFDVGEGGQRIDAATQR